MLSTTEALQPAADLAREQLSDARKRLHSLRDKAEKSLSQWHNRLLRATGFATWGQVREISRELARISKKLDGLSSGK